MQTIPQLIKELRNKLWNGKTVNEWLYMGLPEEMRKQIQYFQDSFTENIEKLATITGKQQLTRLRLKDGTFAGKYEWFIDKYKSAKEQYGDKAALTFRILVNDYKHYQELNDKLIQYQEDFLVNLKELELGKTPTKYHKEWLEELQSGKEERLPFYSPYPDNVDLNKRYDLERILERYLKDLENMVNSSLCKQIAK